MKNPELKVARQLEDARAIRASLPAPLRNHQHHSAGSSARCHALFPAHLSPAADMPVIHLPKAGMDYCMNICR
jgi:hypothetical protein